MLYLCFMLVGGVIGYLIGSQVTYDNLKQRYQDYVNQHRDPYDKAVEKQQTKLRVVK